jgi:hypothetical protein
VATASRMAHPLFAHRRRRSSTPAFFPPSLPQRTSYIARHYDRNTNQPTGVARVVFPERDDELMEMTFERLLADRDLLSERLRQALADRDSLERLYQSSQNSFKSDLREQQQQHELQVEELEKQHEVRIEELRHQNQLLRRKVDELTQENARLRKELKVIKTTVQLNTQLIQQQTETINTQQQKITTLQNKDRQKTEQLDEMKSDLIRLSLERDDRVSYKIFSDVFRYFRDHLVLNHPQARAAFRNSGQLMEVIMNRGNDAELALRLFSECGGMSEVDAFEFCETNGDRNSGTHFLKRRDYSNPTLMKKKLSEAFRTISSLRDGNELFAMKNRILAFIQHLHEQLSFNESNA